MKIRRESAAASVCGLYMEAWIHEVRGAADPYNPRGSGYADGSIRDPHTSDLVAHLTVIFCL